MSEPEPDRKTVEEHIKRAFPHDWEKVMREMRWSSLEGCWFIIYAGMTVGIEKDGYIHS